MTQREQDDEKVLAYLKADAGEKGTSSATLRGIGAATSIDPGTVWGCLQRLAASGKTENAGKVGRSTLWKICAL